MTRLLAVTDVHNGNHRRFAGRMSVRGTNDRCELVTGALKYACQHARATQCSAVISLGDLFDVARPEPSVITATQRAIGEVPFVALLGNHEMGMVNDYALSHMHAADATALGPLHPTATVVGTPSILPVGEAVLVLIPFGHDLREAVDDLMVQPRSVDRDGPNRPARILGFHAGIRDSETPFFLREAVDAIDVDELDKIVARWDFDLAIAGNWHGAKAWRGKTSGKPLIQVGTLAPTGFGEEGDRYGWMLDIEVGTNASGPPHVKLKTMRVPGPRFRTMDFVAEMPIHPVEPHCVEMVRVRCMPAQLDDAMRWAEEARAENRLIEVLVTRLDGHDETREQSAEIVEVRKSMTTDRIIEAIRNGAARVDEDIREDVIGACEDHVLRPLATRLLNAMGDDEVQP